MDKMLETALLIALTLLSMVSIAAQITSATLITPPSHIKLEGGTEDSKGNWNGGYWVFTVAVDQADSMIGKVRLPANTSTVKKDINGDDIEVRTGVSIEIHFSPQKAYYKRLLEKASVMILPKYYRGGENKITTAMFWDTSVSSDAVMSPHYQWAESSWQKYTIWEVQVYVEGKLVGKATLNTEGGTKDLVVPTSKGNVLIKHLGCLQGNYGEPEVPSGAVIFNEQYVYESDSLNYIEFDHGGELKKWDSAEHAVRILEGSDAYSVYWTGNVRWTPNALCDIDTSEVEYRPAPYQLEWWGMGVRGAEKGWKGADDFWNYIRDPVEPAIFPSDESDELAEYDCLIEYLNRKTSKGNIANDWLNGYEDWHIEYKDGDAQAVIVDVPWSAYSGVPVATCYVPSELAESWVYRVPISDVRIQSVQWQEGGTEVDIADSKRCSITIKQFAKVYSSAVIYAKVDTDRASIFPVSKTVTLDKNETKTIWFTVENLGVSEDLEGTVTFIVRRSWDNVETDRNSDLKFKLIAPTPEWTIVTVFVVDKETLQPISGAMVYCSAGTLEPMQAITGDKGIVTFDLGTYRGMATFVAEHELYKKETVSKKVDKNPEITIEMIKRDEKDTFPEFPWWIIIAILCSSAMIITLVFIIRRDRMLSRMAKKNKEMEDYKQYCEDMGMKQESIVTTGFNTSKSLAKKGFNTSKSLAKKILGLFGIVGNKLKSLQLLLFGVFLGVLGMFWASNVSPFISMIVPWLPQGFSVPIGLGLRFWIGADTILIFVAALFIIAGFYHLLKPEKKMKIVIDSNKKDKQDE